ncbi:restriction endonuclease subunit S [Planktothrix agardhii]|uniref:restriction endonuclease subunit S n=1 Tax=Planktothrix agardhii TaxID=1160 RepID=UPI001D09FF21|nr:restriction endonuclease subunit S [Planktothrix agardhii]MCB8789023.1 restriction endonuclease subunit S [Planktothrix agardhii 1025]MCF3578746.1 restriction endonuclease subunit S [Planktothrix agardhii 1812]MCF3614260.1 restriction endonuclease subunit S [Planktothrix agardhii 1027]MCF3648009.1 restriction endonuclease subunit S [Planktothrix agardhii 1026]
MELINNNQVPEGYKKTEVGVIPEDWNWIPLKLVCKVNQGLQIAIEKRLKNQNGQAKRYITIQSLNSDANLEYIDNYASSVVCNEEDILMTRTGNTGIVITGVSGVFHNNFFKVKFDKSKIDNYYEQNTARNHQTRISSLNRFFRSR